MIIYIYSLRGYAPSSYQDGKGLDRMLKQNRPHRSKDYLTAILMCKGGRRPTKRDVYDPFARLQKIDSKGFYR